MKRTWILLIAFLVLAGAAAWYFSQKPKTLSSSASSDMDFYVDDPDVIHKIFLADKSGAEPIILERNGDHWIYDGKHKARQTAVNLLLDMFKRVRVEYIMAHVAEPHAIKSLATYGIKVELYDEKDELLKSYYVGGMTNDERGTYMIMEGANTPYVSHIPSWEGNLRARFQKPHPDNWRDKTIFECDPAKIEFLSIEYPKQRNKSFKLEKTGNTFQVTPFYEITPRIQKEVNISTVEAYLEQYRKVYSEEFENNYKKKEEVRQQVPFCKITIREAGGQEQWARFIPKIDFDENGNILPDKGGETVEHYFVDRSTGDFMLGQHYVYKGMFWSYNAFF